MNWSRKLKIERYKFWNNFRINERSIKSIRVQAVFSHRRRKILENSDRNYDRKRTTRLSMFKLVPRFLILHSCVNFLSNYSNLSKRWSKIEISFHELFQYCVYLIRWVLFNEGNTNFLKNLLKISSTREWYEQVEAFKFRLWLRLWKKSYWLFIIHQYPLKISFEWRKV